MFGAYITLMWTKKLEAANQSYSLTRLQRGQSADEEADVKEHTLLLVPVLQSQNGLQDHFMERLWSGNTFSFYFIIC